MKSRRSDRPTRRALLAGLGGAWLLPSGCHAPDDAGDTAAEPSELWLSAHGGDQASYALLVASAEGVVARIESGFRGHDERRPPTTDRKAGGHAAPAKRQGERAGKPFRRRED